MKKYASYVEKILKFYIPLLQKAPRWRDDPALMEEEVKAVGADGITDVATRADIYMQQLVKAEIGKVFPSWQFWGEEGDDRNYTLNSSCDYLVINDPIEGTNNFRYRKERQWGSVLAVIEMKTQTPVIGIVAQPVTRRIFVGIQGEGARVLTYDESGKIYRDEKLENVPEENYFTYNNSPHFEPNLVEQVRRFFLLGNVAVPAPDQSEIEKSRKVVVIDKVDNRRETFVDPECGNLEPILYRGVLMFKINIEIAAAMVIAQEMGQTATDGDGKPWSIGIRSALFGRSQEDWDYLKSVYEKTRIA